MNRKAEARLLYHLLSAAEEEGRLCNAVLACKWQDARDKMDFSRCEEAYPNLAAIFAELERTDTLAGTWIMFRWQQAREKMDVKRRRE